MLGEINVDNIVCILFVLLELFLTISKYDFLAMIPIIVSCIIYLSNKNEVYYILSASLLVIFIVVFLIKKVILMCKSKKTSLEENKGVI